MTRTPAFPLVVAASLTGMRDPVYSLPLHDIDQMRAVAGLLRAFIDEQAPCDNEGTEWKPDPSYRGIAAAWCHLDAAIKASEKPAAGIGETQMLFLGGSKTSFKCDASDEAGNVCRANCFRKIGHLRYKCNACGSTYTGE